MTLIFLRIFVNDKLKNIIGQATNNGINTIAGIHTSIILASETFIGATMTKIFVLFKIFTSICIK